jgi:nucleotide-binding universal stress UspA family protein
VLGPHRRSGLLGHLQGSVAAAVVAHSTTPVLVIPQPQTVNGHACATTLREAF